VVLTSGELLRDEDLHLGFDSEDRQADTRVRVADAWLERAGMVERNENRTRVFQGRPAVVSLEEAERRIARLGLSAAQKARWLAVLEALIKADPDEEFTADELARLPAFTRAEAESYAGERGSLELRQTDRDHCPVRLQRDWRRSRKSRSSICSAEARGRGPGLSGALTRPELGSAPVGDPLPRVARKEHRDCGPRGPTANPCA